MERFACKKWDRDNYICPKVTKMGSIIGLRIDYDGVAAAHTQKKKLTQVPPPPATSAGQTTRLNNNIGLPL